MTETYNPFSFGTKENGKVIIKVGQYQVSNMEFDTTEEAEKYLEQKPWEIILTITGMMVEGTIKKLKEMEEKS